MPIRQKRIAWGCFLAIAIWLSSCQTILETVAKPAETMAGPGKVEIGMATPTLVPQLQGAASDGDPYTSASTIDDGSLPKIGSTLPKPKIVGYSFNGSPIVDYQLGNGQNKVVLVGGIHGGYEWNTILLVYSLLDHYLSQPGAIPDTVTLHIIPNANPDGLFAVTGMEGRFSNTDLYSDTLPGRFNGHGVDLNRNWDCQWLPTGIWRGNEVSAGVEPFSEPETIALRDHLLDLQPDAVVFYHSAANGVFASGCPNLYQPSMDLATTYSLASGYPVYERFYHYDINGDAGDWLSTKSIPSFTVELNTRDELDWKMNLAGVQVLLASLAKAEQ